MKMPITFCAILLACIAQAQETTLSLNAQAHLWENKLLSGGALSMQQSTKAGLYFGLAASRVDGSAGSSVYHRLERLESTIGLQGKLGKKWRYSAGIGLFMMWWLENKRPVYFRGLLECTVGTPPEVIAKHEHDLAYGTSETTRYFGGLATARLQFRLFPAVAIGPGLANYAFWQEKFQSLNLLPALTFGASISFNNKRPSSPQ